MATQTRNPTSDEAASGTLSGSAGSRWTLVDDYPDTGGTDSITFGTAAAAITFGFSAFTIPAGSTSISVQVQYHDGEAANGANNCAGRVKVGGSYFNSATHNPSGTGWTSRQDNWATNPKSAAAWTVDDVNGVGANALQAFGINSTDSNPTFRVSGVQLQVTYTAPASSGDAASAASTQTTAASGSVVVSATGATSASAQSAASVGVVVVAGSGTTASSAQTSAADGTVGGSGISGDAATGATAQVSAASGVVIVVGQCATAAGAQATSSSAGVVIASSATTAAATQASAAAGVSTIAASGATMASAQQTSGYDAAPVVVVTSSWSCRDRNRRQWMAARRRR